MWKTEKNPDKERSRCIGWQLGAPLYIVSFKDGKVRPEEKP